MLSTPYQGNAFPPGLDGESVSGPITVTPEALTFVARAHAVTMPLDGLIVTAGGFNDQLLIFRHPSLPGWTVSSPDRALLDDPTLLARPAIASQAGRIKHAARGFLIKILGLAALLIAALVGLTALKEPLVTATARQIPLEWEERIGAIALQQWHQSSTFCTEPRLLAPLTPLLATLAETSPGQGPPFTIHLLKDPRINAFALPGGPIVITTGLVLAVSSGPELAGVVAHEMAHITLRHATRQLITKAGLGLMLQVILGDSSPLATVVTENAAFFWTLKNSRNYERQADNQAWDTLIRARIDPRGMIDFFSFLLQTEGKAEAGETTEQALNFFSTHPLTSERIAALKSRLRDQDEPGGYIDPGLDLGALQADIRLWLAAETTAAQPLRPVAARPARQ